MNTSHTPRTLTAEQLEAFLDGKLPPDESKRVQQLLDDCELSKEALEGYSMVPGAFADVDALKKSIAKKSGMGSLNWPAIGLSVVAVAALSVALVVFTGGDPEQKQDIAQTIAAVPDAVIVSAPENMLSPSEDHFVNPEAKVIAVQRPKATVTPGSEPAVQHAPEFVLEPIPVGNNRQLIVDTVPVTPKVVEKGQYNAQVGFIVNLKVTEFDKYYTTTIEVKETPLTGVPARYEDDHGIIREYEEEETVKQVPADQFLREGLIAFRNARYGKCVSKMEVLLNHNANDINALFYTAVSYVKLEMYSKAIPLLDKIIADPNNVFDEEAQWYKALALEGKGDSAAAQELFRQIADKNGFYAEQAKCKLR